MPSAEELKAAIQSRDAEKVRALLRDDPSLAACRLPDGGTPALLAIYYGAADVLEALVTRGVKLDVFEAAAAGDTSRMRVLLDADPTLVSQRSHDGWTPLHLAAHFGRERSYRRRHHSARSGGGEEPPGHGGAAPRARGRRGRRLANEPKCLGTRLSGRCKFYNGMNWHRAGFRRVVR